MWGDIDKSFKKADYIFKFVTWQLTAAAIKFASKKLDSYWLYCTYFFLISIVSILTGYCVATIVDAVARGPRRDQEYTTLRWMIFGLVALLSVGFAAWINFHLQHDFDRLVALQK